MLSVGVTGIVFLGTFGSKALQLRITTGLVLMVVVVGIYAFIGNSGVVSFGHISFMAIGGYTAAILTFPVTQKNVLLPDLPAFIRDSALHYIPAILLGGFVAVLFAVIVGYPLMRLSGIAAAIAMFALLIVVNTVIGEAEPITRGAEGSRRDPVFHIEVGRSYLGRDRDLRCVLVSEHTIRATLARVARRRVRRQGGRC